MKEEIKIAKRRNVLVCNDLYNKDNSHLRIIKNKTICIEVMMMMDA